MTKSMPGGLLSGAAKQKLLLPFFFCVYALLSFYVFAVFLSGSGFGGIENRSITSMIDGTAIRPTQYRVLVPMLTRAVVAVTPDVLQQGVSAWVADARDNARWFKTIIHARSEAPPSSLRDGRLYETWVGLMWVYVSLCLYLYFLYRLAAHFWPANMAYRLFAPVFGLVMIPPFHYQFAYIYDYPAMVAMAAGLYCIVRQRERAYFAVLILATLNRETSFYLMLLYALCHAGSMPRQKLARAIFVQVALFALIRFSINAYYEDGSGAGLVSFFYKQWWIMLSGYDTTQGMSALLFFWLIAYRWQEKPAMLRLGMWLLPVSVAAFIQYGWPQEYRTFMEIFPIIALMFTHTLVRASKLDEQEFFALPVKPPAHPFP